MKSSSCYSHQINWPTEYQELNNHDNLTLQQQLCNLTDLISGSCVIQHSLSKNQPITLAQLLLRLDKTHPFDEIQWSKEISSCKDNALALLLRMLSRGGQEVDESLLIALFLVPPEVLFPDYLNLIQNIIHEGRSERTRILAIQLLWVILWSCLDPVSNETPRPYWDDAFILLSDTLNDVSKSVFGEAIGLLGTIQNARESFVLQSIDKSPYDPVPNSGTKSHSPIMPSSAHGIFVHGLEDEFENIRNTTMYAMRELALSNATFANKAIDSILGMLNDEMFSVRHNAISTFRSIMNFHDIKFTTSQLLNSAVVLHDASKIIREEAYELLGYAQFEGSGDFISLLESLNKNILRYVEDRQVIYETFLRLGASSVDLVVPLVNQILSITPGFLPKEKNIDDPIHMGHLYLLYGAGQPVRQMLPEYIISKQFPRIQSQCEQISSHRKDLYAASTRLFNDSNNVSRALNNEWQIVRFCIKLCQIGQFAKALDLANQVCESLTKSHPLHEEDALNGLEHFLIDFVGLLNVAIQVQACESKQSTFFDYLVSDMRVRAESILVRYICLSQAIREACVRFLQCPIPPITEVDVNMFESLELSADLIQEMDSVQRKYVKVTNVQREQNPSSIDCPLLIKAKLSFIFLEREISNIYARISYINGSCTLYSLHSMDCVFKGHGHCDMSVQIRTPLFSGVPASISIELQGPSHLHTMVQRSLS